ncbi:MAG TPA: phage holin family protein [Rugosimonospora sp.]|nr:phage holin family protein [Rugosimonospora sp.]
MAQAVSEQSTAELVRRATEQVSTLVRAELTLAKSELAGKAKHAGKGAGLFGGAGLVALYGLAVLIAAAVVALDLVLPLWLAAVVVGGALLLIAGILALVGRRQVKQGVPPVPAGAVASIRADIDTLKRSAHHG